MGVSFSKVVSNTAKAVGLSFLLASCASVPKDTDKGPAPDPNATYEHSNKPFSPPIAPKKDGEGKLSPFESSNENCKPENIEATNADCLNME
ncbi:MAG: hypothetical protein ACTHOO_08075 [Alcanivorax sp.]